jgi:hypothetical protein
MLVDDLDGGDANETVRFALDGAQYDIDLSEKNAATLREVLAPWVAAGTKVARGGVVSRIADSGKRRPTGLNREQNKVIREWAQSKGIVLSDRGRIAKEIVARYNAEAGVAA